MKDHRETILIGGKPLHYRVRRHRRARKFTLRVDRDQGVVVVVPWRASLQEVPGLLTRHQQWLQDKVDDYDCWLGPRIRQYATGSELLVLGRPRRLQIEVLPANRMRPRFTLTDDQLRVALSQQDVLDPREALEGWLRRLARIRLNDRVDHWAEVTGLYPMRVRISGARTRWGSCSARGTVSLCYRLIMAPPEAADSVVVHELCHLEHLNHSRRFYALLEHHFPDYHYWDRWLREHGEEIKL